MSSILHAAAFLESKPIVAPVAITAANTSSALDVSGYEGQGGVEINWTKTSATELACKIQGSADGSTGWADISGATVNMGSASGCKKINYSVQDAPKYIRTVCTPTGGSTDGVLSVTHLGLKKSQ